MNKNEFTISSILLILFLTAIILYLSLTFKPINRTVNNYYQVYLGGDKIGLIKSKDELYDLIDQ